MELSDTSGARFDFLLSQLREGNSVTRGLLTLTLLPEELQCAVGTLMDRHTVTEARARDTLGRARDELEALLGESPALAATVAGRPVRYILVHGLERWGTPTDLAELAGDDFRWTAAVSRVRRAHPHLVTERTLRHLTRSELRRRYAELRALLDQWDPLRSTRRRGQPPSDHEWLVGPILRFLEAKEASAVIAQFLREELKHAELERPKISPEQIADRIYSWYTTHWPNTGSAPTAG